MGQQFACKRGSVACREKTHLASKFLFRLTSVTEVPLTTLLWMSFWKPSLSFSAILATGER